MLLLPTLMASEAGCMPARVPTSTLGGPDDSFYIAKTVFEEAVRFVFVAGLEGTGHHALEQFWNRTGKARAFSTRSRKNQDALDAAFFLRPPGASGKDEDEDKGKSQTKEYSTIASARERVKTAMRGWHNDLVGTGPGALKDSALVLMNTMRFDGGKMMSYPTGGGEKKCLQIPDIRELAKLAEEAGVDFRVIVLSRDYEDISRSVTKRGFGTSSVVETEDLTVAAAMLASQVQLIDPAFVMCVRYTNLGNLGWWRKPFNGAVSGKVVTHAQWLLNDARWINRAVKAVRPPKNVSWPDAHEWGVGKPHMQQLGAAVSLVDRVARCSEG